MMSPPLVDATVQVLREALTLSRPADVGLSQFFRARPKLGGRDRTFIAEAVFGVLRHLRSLEHLAGGREPRRLLFAWLARHGGHNLREFAPLGDAEELAWLRGVKATDLTALPVAVRLDLPDWLYTRLAALYGDDLAALAAALNRPALLDLRVNTLRAERAAVQARLAADGIRVEPTSWSPWGLRVQGKPAINRHPLFLDGTFEVQDEGSQLLALITGARRGEMVCDFCAGAGGKTLALGAMMKNTGRLYAFDVSAKRLAQLKPRLRRSGLSNVHPIHITGENDARVKRLAGKFDRVLVDAPCSGLGTLRRNPDLKWRQTPQSIAELTGKQTAILAAAADLVKPGGRLVYATCSLLAEENEAIVTAFRNTRPDFRPMPAGEALAAQKIPLEMGETLALNPARHGTDGFFAAILEKTQ